MSKQIRANSDGWIHAIFAILALVLFAAATYAFQYRGGFAEYDIYWVATGLLHGATTGLETNSPMQYLVTVSFGFYETFYALFSANILKDAARLTEAINQVGWVSAILSLVALWIAISFAEDRRTATIVMVLFGFGAAFLEASTSGHPFLPALALLFIGACFLWAPLTGPVGIASWAIAALFLAYSLCVRADSVLAFPWLLLARPDLRNIGSFLSSALIRAIPIMAAFAIFLALQSQYANVPHGPQAVQGGGNALVDFLQTFYQPSRIGTGLIYLVLTAGIATTVVACVAFVILALGAWRNGLSDDAGRADLRTLIGAVALLGPNLLFWLPNPSPARHFCMIVIVLGLVIAALIRRSKVGPTVVAAALCTLIISNEALSEMIRPVLLPRMAVTLPDFGTARPTHPLLPLGFIWRHHESLQQAADIKKAQADKLSTACNPQIVVYGLDFVWVLPHFKMERPLPSLRWASSPDMSYLTVRHEGRELILAFNLERRLNAAALQKAFPDAIIIMNTQTLDLLRFGPICS